VFLGETKRKKRKKLLIRYAIEERKGRNRRITSPPIPGNRGSQRKREREAPPSIRPPKKGKNVKNLTCNLQDKREKKKIKASLQHPPALIKERE